MTGADLREWRKRNDRTQESLALELGVTRQTVVHWERSAAPLAKMVRLALRALEIEPGAAGFKPATERKLRRSQEAGRMALQLP